MPTRAFIAYDFALTEKSLFENTLAASKKGQPPELDIHYPGDDGEAKEQGTIWNSLVKKEIDLCDKFIAFVDLPNANVGFEIGYACGKGKEVGVYRYKDSEHHWLKQHPLRGHFRHQAKNKKSIHNAFLIDKLISVNHQPSGGDSIVVLCPNDADSLLDEIDAAWNWKQPPLDSWSLDDSLPNQFDDCGLVVWIITPHGKGDAERDGTENTCLSILAGYAEARPELDLRIFIHEGARAVADMEHCSKRFKSNDSLKIHLTALASEWSAKVAARKAPVTPSVFVPAVAPVTIVRPGPFPPLPTDHFVKTGNLFIGRQSELGSGADMVQGLVARFRKTGGTMGTAGIRLLWVHGFGGMGKSWFLHRIRLQGEEHFPEIRSLVIDWDKSESRAPLTDIPRAASEVYELIAIRLCQCFGAEAADAFWEAKRLVADKHRDHQSQWDQLRAECNRACTEDRPRLDPLLASILKGDGFWSEDKAARTKKISLLEGDVIRYQSVLASWCHAKGETENAICAPHQVLAEGLRHSIRAAMASYPLIFLLDTCEVLLPVLDHALRQLFAPLLSEAAPLLILVGSRLRADLHQPPGGKRGWRAEIPQETFSPLDFGADRRFTVPEIEGALARLARPFEGDSAMVAARLHVVTLGIPLAVRGLLDLHEQGDGVLAQMDDDSDARKPLSEKAQIRKVIGMVADRFLLNLADRPELEEDLRDIVALALVPRFDAALFASYWGVTDIHGRISKFASRYSLLSDGDLHEVVRSYLRQHWRNEKARPECFSAVLSDLRCAAHDSTHSPQTSDQPARIAALSAELNLRSWAEGSRVVDAIARALTLALVYEADTSELAGLLRELPPAEGGSAEVRNLWQRDADKAPTEREIVPWLKVRHAASKKWSDEEIAALALLEGITTAARGLEPAVARNAVESLEKAVVHFGLNTLPRQANAGEAFFDCAHSLDPLIAKLADWLKTSATAYERAIALHHLESIACNNVANLYSDMNRPEEAEAMYREAIRLDPKFAYPHNGLGNLYRDDLNRPEEAEAAYREAIRLDPKNASPHNGLGSLYEEAGRWETAEEEFRQEAALDPKTGGGQRGLVWVALLARGDFGGAREFAAEAMKLAANHPGSPLAVLAVDAWAGDWPEALRAFADWVRELPAKNESFTWISRNRLAALLQKAHKAGQLAAMAEPIRAAVGRACWQPWAEALEAVLAGRDATGLSAKAADLHARLTSPASS